MTVHWPERYGWLGWERGTDHAMSHCVKASSLLMREVSSVQRGTAQAAHFLTETAVWALQSWPQWWMASTAKERKEKGAWEPSEDQYVRTGEPASHVKNPDPTPALPASRSLCCLLHPWQTSLWEQVGGELSLRREDFSVCMCRCMCIYMKCVSRFLEGLGCQKTQGQHRAHTSARGTHMHTENPLAVDALREAMLWHSNSEVSKAMDILLMSPKQWLD